MAAIIHNDTRIAGRTSADGVHVDSGIADVQSAVAALHPRLMVGAGGIRSRHDAMAFGEAGPDYLFFGRLDGDTGDDIHPKALDLAAWCAVGDGHPGDRHGRRHDRLGRRRRLPKASNSSL